MRPTHPTPRLILPLLLLTTAILPGDPTPQPQMTIAPGAHDTMNLDWDGIPGRTYFTEFSMNLMDWFYAPFIDFGDGGHHRGMHSDSPRMFLRLAFTDWPGIHSLEDAMNADFSGDGLSNIFKITHGYDPFEFTANDDADQDGLLLINEQLFGRNPHRRDHPAVKLNVIVGN